MKRYKIVVVGAGNVATHLAKHLHRLGQTIVCVCSRTRESAENLASALGCGAITDLSLIPCDVDFVLIATTDSSIEHVSEVLPQTDAIVAHTSGSIPLDVLSRNHRHAAVLYPLQTFSKDVAVDIRRVPFFIEASDAETLSGINKIARLFSENVLEADSTLRSRLHVAGVLSSNFTIYLLEMTRRVLAEHGLVLSTVRPLVEASIIKAFETSPLEALTGPARRGDRKVVESQSRSFTNDDDRRIYDALSGAIIKKFEK